MLAKKLVYSLLLVAAAGVVLYPPAQCRAAGKDGIIGKGSPISKRVHLTRFHGMANAPKLRLAAIRAHKPNLNK